MVVDTFVKATKTDSKTSPIDVSLQRRMYEVEKKVL